MAPLPRSLTLTVAARTTGPSLRPMTDFLTRSLGITLRVVPYGGHAPIVDDLAAGNVDLALLPPLAYIVARDRRCANPLLILTRQGRRTHRGVYLAHARSGIRTLRDARGKRVMLTDPQSAAGYLYPLADAARLAGDPYAFFGTVGCSDDDATSVRAVAAGGYDLAAVDESAAAGVAGRLVKIGQTGEAPNGTITVRSGLPTTLMGRTQGALREFAATTQGRQFLVDGFHADGLAPANDREFDAVRDAALVAKIPLQHYGARPTPQRP